MINENRVRMAVARLAVVTMVLALIAWRAPEWTKGLDSEFIVYGQTGPGVPVSDVTKIIAQVVAGSGDQNVSKYKTVIQVINEGTDAATVSGNFYNEDGSTSTLVLKTNVSTMPTVTGSFAALSLPANGILTITADAAASLTVNWGKIVSRGGTVSTSAYFDLTSGDGSYLYSRVGVPASDASLSKFTIPRVRNVDSGLDVGFALVNTGKTSATINAVLRNSAGTSLGTKNLTLAAGAHTAKFAREFFALTGESAGTNYSFMTFEASSAQFAVTALAIEGGSLAGFPISVPGTAVSGDIADGSVTAAKLASGAVTADKVASGQVVKSINTLRDDVTLVAGSNVTINSSGNTLTISAAGSTGGPSTSTNVAGAIFLATGSDQTLTVPTGVTQLFVEAWGGGGQGGKGSSASGGGGGGGGGFFRDSIPVTAGAKLTISVGLGGGQSGGSAAGGNTIVRNSSGQVLATAFGGAAGGTAGAFVGGIGGLAGSGGTAGTDGTKNPTNTTSGTGGTGGAGGGLGGLGGSSAAGKGEGGGGGGGFYNGIDVGQGSGFVGGFGGNGLLRITYY